MDSGFYRNRQPLQEPGERGARTARAQPGGLRQLSGALPTFLEERPAVDDLVQPKLSWRVHVLPYVEHRPLYEKFKLDEPWDSPHNVGLLDEMPQIYREEGDPPGSTTTRMQLLMGRGTAFIDGKRVRPRQCRDGTDVTVIAVSTGADKAVPWTKPEDIEFDFKDPLASLGTPPSTGLAVMMYGGQVHTLKADVPADLFVSLVTPAGGEELDVERLREYGLVQLADQIGRNRAREAEAEVEQAAAPRPSRPAPVPQAEPAATEQPGAETSAGSEDAAKTPAVVVVTDEPPPALEPEPVPDAAARAEMQKEDEQVAEKLAQARAETLGVYVRFEALPDGAIHALINAGATIDPRTEWTLEQRLTFGNGIPLVPAQVDEKKWKVEPVAEADAQLLPSRREGDFELSTLKLWDAPSGGSVLGIRRLVWSPDGSMLYVLDQRGALFAIDARTWKGMLALRPEVPIVDIALCSRGLVALQQAASSDVSKTAQQAAAAHWIQVEEAPGGSTFFPERRLLVIDPTSLAVQRGYRVDGALVVGDHQRDFAYVFADVEPTNNDAELLVVNLATGELVNAITVKANLAQTLLRRVGASSEAAYIGRAFNAYVTSDGRTLVTVNDNVNRTLADVERYLLTGPQVQRAAALTRKQDVAGASSVTSDGQFLWVPRGSQRDLGLLDEWTLIDESGKLELLRVGELERPVGTLRDISPALPYAIDPVSKLVVLTEPAYGGQQVVVPGVTRLTGLTWRALQDGAETRISLPERELLAMWPVPAGRGVLGLAPSCLYWLEPQKMGIAWHLDPPEPPAAE